MELITGCGIRFRKGNSMSSLFESLPFAIVLLLIGFVFLIKGADLFVDGSSNIAKKLCVPSVIIGLTIVAMGTSLPETAVSVTASLVNNNTLAISNAVGSNIFNMMVVIGFCGVITPVAVQEETLKRDFPFSVICALLLLGMGCHGMALDQMEGLILVVLFIGFILTMIRAALKARKTEQSQEDETEKQAEKTLPVWKCLLFVVIGVVGIALGGDWVVEGASTVATAFGLSQTLIGLTIVSIGTSLPELVTSVVAARKKEVDLAVGNAIGSNIFNILMVLGIASTISPIDFIMNNVIDIVILVVFSIIVWMMAKSRKKMERREGLIMLLLYAGYMVYIIVRP